MDDRTALLRAILASPEDDLPRRVYADWLEEHGEYGIAEFVRVQCDLAALKMPRGIKNRPATLFGTDRQFHKSGKDSEWGRRRTWLLRREVDLLELHWHEWSGRIATYCANFHKNGAFGVRFTRGFVSSIRLPLAAFLAHAPTLFSRHPITAVRLTDREPGRGNNTDGLWYFTDSAPNDPLDPDERFPWWLPTAFYDLMPRTYERATPTDLNNRHDCGAFDYPTRDAAHAALSAAALQYGRSLASLPALTPAVAVG